MHNPQLTDEADNQVKRAPVIAPSDIPDVWVLGAEINRVGELIVATDSAKEVATYDGVLSVLGPRISARLVQWALRKKPTGWKAVTGLWKRRHIWLHSGKS